MFKFIAKQIRRFNYHRKFKEQYKDMLLGLNPDKHNQVFNSYFAAEEKKGSLNK